MNGLQTAILIVFVGFWSSSSLMAHSQQIQSFFNNSETKSYTDPYRNVVKRGDDLEQVLISEIEKADKSVLLAIQELRLPLLASALIKKKEQGIDVKVILENQYNKDILSLGSSSRSDEDDEDQDATKYYDLFAFIDTDFDGEISKKEMSERDAIYMLNQAGIVIKDDTSDGSLGSALMHHKFLVIDDKTTIVSSANFTLSGVHGDYLNDASTGNANGMLVIDSIEVSALFSEEFYIMWGGENQKLGSRFGVRKPYRGPQKIKVGSSYITVQFSPTSKKQHWPATVNGLIGRTLEKARENVSMALFVYSDQAISEVLRRRVLDNPQLKVNVLVEPKFAYRYYSELLDLWGLKLLDDNCKYEEGNHPWRRTRRAQGGVTNLNRGDVLHHKFAVVDKSTVIFGSQNWSDAANFSNDEFVVVVEDNDIAAAFQDEFDRLFEGARLGPPRSLRQRIIDAENRCARN